jgi:hypothetical protein
VAGREWERRRGQAVWGGPHRPRIDAHGWWHAVVHAIGEGGR